MAFTVMLLGNRREQFFYARVPNGSPLEALGQPDSRFQEPNSVGVYACQWAEVAYFLARPIDNPTAEGTPLFALYRRQRLLVPDNEALNWGPGGVPIGQLPLYERQISCTPHKTDPTRIYFNGPHDVTIPERRLGMNDVPGSRGLDRNTTGGFTIHRPHLPLVDTTSGVRTGDDLLLTNVLSFDIQVMTTIGGSFTDLTQFDTWSRRQDDVYDYSTVAVPSSSRIVALQIVLRIWDPTTKQTRQVTIVQDM
jgi:hypothetical protein